MGQSYSSEATQSIIKSTDATESKYEYLQDPFFPSRRSTVVPTLICTDYQCMLIGAYGDQYSANVKGDVVPKQQLLPTKPGGKFLPGVSDDLEIVQELIRKDPRKQLAYVLSDIPGAQRSVANYLFKIESLFKECTCHGALIWYTGHGQKMTGNWCFKDGVITFENVFDLYKKYFRGKLLTIICDCCYSGQWVDRCIEIMNNLGIGACGHKARDSGFLIKIFASCDPSQVAYDTCYSKQNVNVDSSKQLMTFLLKPIKIGQGSQLQTPYAIDLTKVSCFSKPDEPCKFDQIPQRASWTWTDFTNIDRIIQLKTRLFKVWGQKDNKPFWWFLIVYKDKFEEFCRHFETRTPSTTSLDYDDYGYTVFCGFGENPPSEVEIIFSQYGPCEVRLPQSSTTSINRPKQVL